MIDQQIDIATRDDKMRGGPFPVIAERHRELLLALYRRTLKS